MFGIKKSKSIMQAQKIGSGSVNIQVAGDLGTVSLQKKVDAARVSLTKKSLVGRKMAVMAYVDASGSMSGFYRNGTVQELTERALGFAINVDSDGEVPIFGFGYAHESHGTVTAQNYQGYIADSDLGPYGSTNLSASLMHLEKAAKKTKEPIYALIVTDGEPDDREDVAHRIKNLSNYPVFIKILVVGHDVSAWRYISGLDNMTTGRLLDNVDAQKIDDPSKLSDQQFADKMVEELDGWFVLATNAGLL